MTATGRSLMHFLEMPASWQVSTTCVTSCSHAGLSSLPAPTDNRANMERCSMDSSSGSDQLPAATCGTHRQGLTL